ncbi:hydrophobic surface binding protein A-domain-containing protein [Xylaria cf. heliscus]|nr:hydrophobic surface binding protein A-domain-containing protein [Xylaria cf. heliscus]
MKATTFLPVAFAFTAVAEMQLYSLPTPVRRDISTVTSAVAQISDAITQLDNSVKAFESDATQLKSAADNLVSTIKDGASAIASAGSIQLSDVPGLQDVATSLATAGQTLITDFESKKAAFQASQLCSTVQSTIQSIGSEVKDFVDAVVQQLPASVQDTAKQLTSGLTDKLDGGADSFGDLQCKDGASSSSSSAAAASSSSIPAIGTVAPSSDVAEAYPTSLVPSWSVSAPAGGAVTVTVTAPCVCESSSSSSSIPLLTPSVSVPYPTGSNTTSVLPTGAVTTTPATSIPTAGAVANGVGAVGLMAGLAAALFV